MKCTECDGSLKIEEGIDLSINEVQGNRLNYNIRSAFPCEKCSLLHTLTGDEVHKTPDVVILDGKKCFLVEGKIVKLSKYRTFADVKQLPKIPTTIKPLKAVDGEPQPVSSVVIGGLNLIGESGYMCPTVTLLNVSGENGKFFGWSLCIGNPDQTDEVPYYFETSDVEGVSGTARGTEIPNAMTYFQAEVDSSLTTKDASIEQIDEVMAFVLPYISDGGPPPPYSSEEAFEQVVHEWCKAVAEVQVKEVLKKAEIVLDGMITGFIDEWNDYWQLFEEVNKRFHYADFSHAWKSHPNDPDYNPDFGILEKQIGKRTIRISVGLPKDNFFEACAVVSITPHD